MKVLIVKTNSLFTGKELEEIRQDILRQINNGGVIVVDNCYKVEVVEVDTVKAVVSDDDLK